MPSELSASIEYGIGKVRLANMEWASAQRRLAAANQAAPDPLLDNRISLLRKKQPLMDDSRWSTIASSVPKPARLSPDQFRPTLHTVVACGAYYSRGSGQSLPWTRLTREAKKPPENSQERAALVSVTIGYFCRYLFAQTSLLRTVDLVVSIPSDPERFLWRGFSLPDELAQGIEDQCAVPFLRHALRRTKSVELRGLSRAQRRIAVQDSMTLGQAESCSGRHILVVDDVITHGTTILEATSVLMSSGPASVSAYALSHTEG